MKAIKARKAAILCLLLATGKSAAAERGGVNYLLERMSIEEKVGQMLFISLREGRDVSSGQDTHTYLTARDKTLFTQLSPGGVVLFSENIVSDEQCKKLIDDIKARYKAAEKECAILPFISVDQEGGRVQRIKHSPYLSAATLPAMLTVGESGKTRDAFRIGRIIGGDLAELGFNMDFAPVCDVFSNPKNTVIGDRAFSRVPRTASLMSYALSRGLKSKGIIPCPKHFPGHGDTVSDSHEGTAVLNKNIDELNKTELVPFRRQIKGSTPAIMVAHITLPQFDNAPSTLSRAIVTDLLRKDLGFKGVVITDALGMKAITVQYSNEEAAVLAVKAGCDMLLMCEDSIGARSSIVDACKKGEISIERINESVRRILSLKAKYSLIRING